MWWSRLVVRLLKRSIRITLRSVAGIPVGRRYCCICESSIAMFMPGRIPTFRYKIGWGFSPPLMEALDVVGSDLAQYNCPRCGCNDRDRHLSLYLNTTGITAKIRDAYVLHFAPEKWIKPIIDAQKPGKYVRCDLYPSSQDIEKVDMLDIPYQDETFDIVIANHVLEHVSNYLFALRELKRVLKKGGVAILQTPYSKKIEHTLCDNGIDTKLARFLVYGQDDHVRLFGADIFREIESVGFKSRVVNHVDVLSGIDAKFCGVNVKEPFFLFERI
jgi:SAM-dependent methyltransferase